MLTIQSLAIKYSGTPCAMCDIVADKLVHKINITHSSLEQKYINVTYFEKS